MRARVVAAGLALLAGLAGCTAAEPARDAAETTGAPEVTTSASPVGAARLDCEELLPVAVASDTLAVPESALEGTRDGGTPGSATEIREAAQENGGLLTCSWFEKAGTAAMTVSLAEDAAEAFAASGRTADALATDAEAYGSCSAGSCGIDLLTGSTWMTVTLAGAPEGTDLAALAEATASSAVGSVDEPITATAPVCAELLTPDELAATAGLVEATPGAGTEGAPPASASAAAAARAGYASCTWTDASSSTYTGLTIDVLPHGERGWRDLSLEIGLAVPLEPLDGLGEKALAGCAGGSCEIDVLSDGTWWRVLVTGDAARAEAVARAVIA